MKGSFMVVNFSACKTPIDKNRKKNNNIKHKNNINFIRKWMWVRHPVANKHQKHLLKIDRGFKICILRKTVRLLTMCVRVYVRVT